MDAGEGVWQDLNTKYLAEKTGYAAFEKLDYDYDYEENV